MDDYWFISFFKDSVPGMICIKNISPFEFAFKSGVIIINYKHILESEYKEFCNNWGICES